MQSVRPTVTISGNRAEIENCYFQKGNESHGRRLFTRQVEVKLLHIGRVHPLGMNASDYGDKALHKHRSLHVELITTGSLRILAASDANNQPIKLPEGGILITSMEELEGCVLAEQLKGKVVINPQMYDESFPIPEASALTFEGSN